MGKSEEAFGTRKDRRRPGSDPWTRALLHIGRVRRPDGRHGAQAGCSYYRALPRSLFGHTRLAGPPILLKGSALPFRRRRAQGGFGLREIEIAETSEERRLVWPC